MSARRLPLIISSAVVCFSGVFLATSAAAAGPDAFSRPVAGLTEYDQAPVHLGNSLFRKSWRPAPSETTASDGLGPLYNARACSDCHVGDGRGNHKIGLILKLRQPDPVYGVQIQDKAVAGIDAEGQVLVRYEESAVELSDGTIVRLRRPIYEVADLKYGPFAAGIGFSPRLAPPVFGLGLLEPAVIPLRNYQ